MKLSTNHPTMTSPEALAALVRHELNYPLNTLQGAIRLLSTGSFGALSKDGSNLLDQALISLDRLNRLATAVEENQSIATALLSAEQLKLLELKRDLPNAIETGQIYLVYQPIVDAHTKAVVAFEALARWEHPTQGTISPMVFIPLAEETNLIHALGQTLIEQACRQLRQWQDRFPSHPPLQMSVNVSPLQLLQLEFPKHVEATLQATQIESSSLKLEITESALLENNEVVALVLEKLSRLGIKLHMDDFGTGYSTLSRLQVLPVDTLKIDRSFVANRNWEICEIVVALAQKMNFKIIVEGVETKAEMETLQRIGLKTMQGYLFSPPLQTTAMTALLAQSPARQTDTVSSSVSATSQASC